MRLSTVDAFKHIRVSGTGMTELSPEQLAALQRTLNVMLGDIADCCERGGIWYVLGGGSCLGAIRHHGMIPWDDDVDINMPRGDHDRFVRLFAAEYGSRYWIHTPKHTQGYGLTFTRVLLKGTCVKTREDFHNDECGAFIDIFVIENTYDRALPRRLHGLGCMAMGFLQSCSKFYRDRRELTALAETIDDPAQKRRYRRIFRVKIVLGALTAFRGTDAWTRAADRMYSRCRCSGSTYVSVPSGRGHFFGELYRREQLCPGILVPYDGAFRRVPPDYDGYLRRLYGDYMTPQPEGDRERHIFFEPFQCQTAEQGDGYE